MVTALAILLLIGYAFFISDQKSVDVSATQVNHRITDT
jgi:hypothetical protein